ncbi:MAG: chemotaxis protein CheA [Methanosarcinales archaeon]
MDTNQYKEVFMSEAREHLELLNQYLLELEQDPSNKEILNQIFRSAHTLKGMSATMGYEKIATFAHEIENVLDKFRNAKLSDATLTPERIDLLFELMDTLERLIGNPDSSESIDLSGLEELKSLTEIEEDENKKTKTFKIKVKLSKECVLKLARALVVIRELEKIGFITETKPNREEIENENFDLDFEVLLKTEKDEEEIKNAIGFVPDLERIEIENAELERLEKPKKPALKSIQSVRVSVDRLDTLMDFVGELVINKIRLAQLARKYELSELKETLDSVDRITTELQDEVMQMRLVPVEHIFNRFPRMVRDLAREKGKEINFITEGKEIELDRTILDQISEPLVHLLRNCIDHGIEKPEEREKIGKARVGTIKLIAQRQENHTTIIIEDDGRGIDPEVIKKKGLEKGIISQEDAYKLNDEESMDLIFVSGFSTAEKVTETSGRGVGMDAVKASIGSLGGSIKIDSKVGVGTKITLQLPLTVAIIQCLLVALDNETYAIPISKVIRTIKIKRSEIKTIQGKEVINYRDKIIPLVYLRKILKVPKKREIDKCVVVLVEKSGKEVGLVLDAIISQEEVVIKNLDYKLLKNTKGFAGATILGDGKVVLILDLISLF